MAPDFVPAVSAEHAVSLLAAGLLMLLFPAAASAAELVGGGEHPSRSLLGSRHDLADAMAAAATSRRPATTHLTSANVGRSPGDSVQQLDTSAAICAGQRIGSVPGQTNSVSAPPASADLTLPVDRDPLQPSLSSMSGSYSSSATASSAVRTLYISQTSTPYDQTSLGSPAARGPYRSTSGAARRPAGNVVVVVLLTRSMEP